MESFLLITNNKDSKRFGFRLELKGYTVWFNKNYDLFLFLKMNGLKLLFLDKNHNEYVNIIEKKYLLIQKKII